MITEFGGAVAVPSAVRNNDSHDPGERRHHDQDRRRNREHGQQRDQLDRALGNPAVALAEIDADILCERRIGERSGGYQYEKK